MKLLQAGVCQVIVGPLVDVSLRFDLVVVRQTVHFVDEHLEVDVRVHFVGSSHRQMQPPQGLHVVILETGHTQSQLGVAMFVYVFMTPH